MAQVEKAGTTGETWDKWDDMRVYGSDSAYEYRGADPTFITLSGETPEQEWITNTMFRRWLLDECICGCGRSAHEEGEDGLDPEGRDIDGRFLLPGCQDRFIERLRQVGISDDCIERNRWSGQYWDTWLRLQDVYRALWTAEIRRGLRGQLHDAEEKVKDAERTAQEAQAEQQRVRQALGHGPDVSPSRPLVLS